MKNVNPIGLGDTWAVQPRVLETYGRQLMSSKPADLEEHRRTKAQEHEEALAFVTSKSMDQLPGSLMSGVHNGVAVIPLMGVIRPRASYSFYYRTSTNLVSLTHDFELALASSSVKSILFNIDSPGGYVAGVEEFAEKVFNARGVKPMKGYVTDMIASAAYWIGSSLDELVMSRTAEAGSIGAMVAFTDWSGFDKKHGIKEVVIVNDESPKKGTDPASDEGQTQIRQRLNDMAEVFITTVARNRSVDRSDVVSKFGQGDLIVGESAEAVGLVDRLGSFDSLLAEMSEENSTNEGFSMTVKKSNPTASGEAEITSELIAGEYPKVAQHFIDQGKAEGIKEGTAIGAEAERTRIKAIETQFAQPGVQAIVNKHKFDPEMSVEQVGMKVLAAIQSGDVDQLAVIQSESPDPISGDAGGQANSESDAKMAADKDTARKAAEEAQKNRQRS